MKCMVLGCERPARELVPTREVDGVTVWAHFCRFCWDHPCEMERYLLRRKRR